MSITPEKLTDDDAAIIRLQEALEVAEARAEQAEAERDDTADRLEIAIRQRGYYRDRLRATEAELNKTRTTSCIWCGKNADLYERLVSELSPSEIERIFNICREHGIKLQYTSQEAQRQVQGEG